MTDLLLLITISLLTFLAAFILIRYGWPGAHQLLIRYERWYERRLVHQLLIDVPPRVAMGFSGAVIVTAALLAYAWMGHYLWMIAGALVGAAVPLAVVSHLQTQRQRRLERQLVDGITTLSSGVRAGMNLVQSIEMLVHNTIGPIRQEFAQLLREYQMGLDLNQAMRHAANRIGSSHFRLLFTALEMHRVRGGDVGESLDRIAESIREIQRLEGKLDAVTASGRFQAMMIAAMPIVLTAILYFVDETGIRLMFTQPLGRALVFTAVGLIVVAFLWIRKIMDVSL